MPGDPEGRAARRRVRFLALGLAAVIGAAWGGWVWWRVGSRSAAPVLFTTSGDVVGEPYSITVVQRGHVIRDKDIRNIVDTALQRADWLLSPTDPNSEISRFNGAKSTAPFRVSPETAEAVACALKVSERTTGAYDLTAAPLLAAYATKDGKTPEIPDAQLAALRAHVGYEKLSVDSTGPTLTKSDPEITIDLRAVLAGFTADLVARALDKRAVESYKIDVGGQAHAKGHDSEGKTWVLGMDLGAGPTAQDDKIVGTWAGLDIVDISGGLASSNHRPVIDARSGRTVTHAVTSVVVLHMDAMWAQAYANAILVLGPDDGYLMAKLLKLPAALVTRGANGEPDLHKTPAFDERFGNAGSK